jgi:hypothetical protein
MDQPVILSSPVVAEQKVAHRHLSEGSPTESIRPIRPAVPE